MEQIIIGIIAIVLGMAWDAYKKHRRAERLKERRRQPHEMPAAEIPVIPVGEDSWLPAPSKERYIVEEEKAPKSAPFLMGEQIMTPSFEAVPPIELHVGEEEPASPEIERWRRAVIDSEILKRRF